MFCPHLPGEPAHTSRVAAVALLLRARAWELVVFAHALLRLALCLLLADAFLLR